MSGAANRSRVEVPGAQLVLLVVDVLLDAGARDVLEELVGGAVDAVARRQRGGEDEPLHERRAPAPLQMLGQDVGRVGPEVGPEVFAQLALRQLAQILGELPLGRAPREVGVRLREAGLGQLLHDLRARERLGEEDGLGVLGLDVADAPLPERQRLGVRVVDAENGDALLDPEQEDRLQLVPQARASRRRRSRTGRRPGTSSAGSRRTGSCRRRGARTTRGAP